MGHLARMQTYYLVAGKKERHSKGNFKENASFQNEDGLAMRASTTTVLNLLQFI